VYQRSETLVAFTLTALARKVIVIDLWTTAPSTVAALGAVALSLGVTYRLIQDADTDPAA
jgi:uncharacterized membrane protein (DUF373 family)